MDAVRIDKWLWAARMFKTRSQAQVACDAGHVHVNEVTAKPARAVRAGDEVRVVAPSGRRILRVVALSEVRGPAAVAATLFVDLTPPPPPEEARVLRDRGAGRPTKRDRRLTERLLGQHDE